MISYCGLLVKLPGNLMYAKRQYTDSSTRVPSQRCDMEGEYTSLESQFWTGLRARHDIIWGAWDRLCKEQAHVI